ASTASLNARKAGSAAVSTSQRYEAFTHGASDLGPRARSVDGLSLGAFPQQIPDLREQGDVRRRLLRRLPSVAGSLDQVVDGLDHEEEHRGGDGRERERLVDEVAVQE